MPQAGIKSESTILLTEAQQEQLAQRLYETYEQGEPITPLSNDYPRMITADSYAIQARLVARHGDAPVGYKLGFTSAAMREQMGVDEPNYGVLLGGFKVGDEVACQRFIHPLIEPEIALITGRELAGADVTLTAVRAAVETFHPALEIVDSRFQKYQFQAVDNIADNSSAAGYCLGTGVDAQSLIAPEEVICRLYKNDQEIAVGCGEDAMGGPCHALHWLVHKLSEFGISLPAGSLILTGGLSRAQPAASGDEFSAEFSNSLGAVALQFA